VLLGASRRFGCLHGCSELHRHKVEHLLRHLGTVQVVQLFGADARNLDHGFAQGVAGRTEARRAAPSAGATCQFQFLPADARLPGDQFGK
jgi:hypothetical protein